MFVVCFLFSPFVFFLVRFLGFCALVWLWQSKLFAIVITKQEE